MKKIFLVLLLLLALTPAYAADVSKDPNDTSSYDQCRDKESNSTANFLECETREAKRLDRILNDSYKKIMNSSISKEDKEEIKKMQRMWLSYRDHFGKILSRHNPDGTLWLSELASSMTEILRRQAIEISNLQTWITDENGK